LGPHESAHQTTLQLVQPFLHRLPVCPTQRDREIVLHAWCLANARIYAQCAHHTAQNCQQMLTIGQQWQQYNRMCVCALRDVLSQVIAKLAAWLYSPNF